MPARNIIKEYCENAYYHFYCRGSNKATVFHDDEDFSYFKDLIRKNLGKLNNSSRIVIYCLMPNHYHFLLYQEKERDIEFLMRRVGTSYGWYYHKKYNHSGRVFQNVYKARLLKSPQEILYTREYIFLNPIKAGYKSWKHSGVKI